MIVIDNSCFEEARPRIKLQSVYSKTILVFEVYILKVLMSSVPFDVSPGLSFRCKLCCNHSGYFENEFLHSTKNVQIKHVCSNGMDERIIIVPNKALYFTYVYKNVNLFTRVAQGKKFIYGVL